MAELVCLAYLYALEGAIADVEFNALPEGRKKELKQFSDFTKNNGTEDASFPCPYNILYQQQNYKSCIEALLWTILQTARIYGNATRKVPGWRSAVGAYCKFN